MYMYYLIPKKKILLPLKKKKKLNERTLREHPVALKRRNRLCFWSSVCLLPSSGSTQTVHRPTVFPGGAAAAPT